ncbi:MAG: hypothetical protein FJX44_03540 [Alphaproteobacteria bacterium]|nr:hypothetical protein [Alphaproteobacteria bacterium]
MMPIFSRLAVGLLVIPLVFFCAPEQTSAQTESVSPPKDVQEAITATPAPTESNQVFVGAYINDIQQIDFKANSYSVDLYVWFRWKNPAHDPAKTVEFMNRFAGGDNIRERLYEVPEKLPDGSLYSFVRYQGYFSTKFDLETYPFDSQYLTVVMEDSTSDINDAVYVPDGKHSVVMDPEITLPGFKVGKPEMKITTNIYPTNFGYLTQPEDDAYSRITLTIPVTRPVLALSLKLFVPILLIVVCASLVFFIRPSYVEPRVGLAITALLTLVALQLTSSSSLPEVDYVMMLDKIYLLAYLFVILIIARVAVASWRGKDSQYEAAIIRGDRICLVTLLVAYLVANAIIVWTSVT